MRDGKPRSVDDGTGIDQAHDQSQHIAGSHADQNRNQLHHFAAEDRNNDGYRKGKAGENQRVDIVDDLFSICLTHGHATGCSGHGQTDYHNHRTDNHGRQQLVYRIQTAPSDQRGKDKVHETGCKQTEHGRRQAPFADGVDNRCNKGKRRAEENRHFTFGNQLEQQGAQACTQ